MCFYYRERTYDSYTGTFPSADPLGFEAGDVNLYRMVGNRVTLYRDPLGLFSLNNVNWTSCSIGVLNMINPTVGTSFMYGGLLGLNPGEVVNATIEGYKHGWESGYYKCLANCMFVEKGHFYVPPVVGEATLQIADYLLDNGGIDWLAKKSWSVKIFNKVPPLGIYGLSKRNFISRMSSTLKFGSRALAVAGLASFIHETYSCTKKCIKCL